MLLYLVAFVCLLSVVIISFAHGQDLSTYRIQQAEQAILELRVAVDHINKLVIGALVALVINLILTVAPRWKRPNNSGSDGRYGGG